MIQQKETHEYFREEAAVYVSSEKILLDAGCGKAGLNDLEPYRFKNKLCVGLDASFEALQARDCFNQKIQGLIEALPFRDNCFDGVISHLVFEHLEDPELAVGEFHRVLKPGGGVIITTNSIFHPMMCLSHVLPLRVRDWIKKHFLFIQDDSFPTYYRFNSLGRIQKIMAQRGFKRCFTTYSNSPYSVDHRSLINLMLFKLFNYYNRITHYSWLHRFKMNIVVHYVKI